MNAQIVMLCSGKGGTGKSTVSVLLGSRLAQLEKKVLLIELSSGLPSVDIIAGVSGQTVYDLSDVLAGRCAPEKATVSCGVYPGLSVISAPCESIEIPAGQMDALCRRVAPFYDFVLLDVASGMGTPFHAASAAADLCLLVLTPDPVTLRDGRIAADALLSGQDKPEREQSAVRLVLNRYTPACFGRDAPVADLDECIDTVGAQLIAILPESRELKAASATGMPLLSSGAACAAGEALAKRLLGQRVPLTIR